MIRFMVFNALDLHKHSLPSGSSPWRVRLHGCNVMTLTIRKGSNSYEANRHEAALAHPHIITCTH